MTTVAERRGLLLGARIANGALAAGVAVAVVAAVSLLPIPTVGVEPRLVAVDPAPADQSRVCAGAVVRVGDAAGGSAGETFVIGEPAIAAAADGAELVRTGLQSDDAAAGSGAAPEVLRAPPTEGTLLAGAQLQAVDAPDFVGLAASSCAEPSGSIWLVGGATTVGRSTFLLLANPTDVPARVTLEIFGEEGPVAAPGLSGIEVPAQGQRVLSLAGFAPGLVSPVVHVTARGGRVVAALQHSVVRGLDSVGVETIGATAEPTDLLAIPGVRIVDTVGTNRASALADWQDVGPVLRLAVPGDVDVRATVRVVPEAEGAVGTSFQLTLDAGGVTDVPLDAADQDGERTGGLGDGVYTVFVEADAAIVGAVRASTAPDTGEESAPDSVLRGPPSDLAWFVAAPPLAGSTLVVVPDGPAPLLTIANPTAVAATLEVSATDGAGGSTPVEVPPGGSVSLVVEPGAYVLSGSAGLAAAVTFAAPATLAAFALAPPRPVAGVVQVRVD